MWKNFKKALSLNDGQGGYEAPASVNAQNIQDSLHFFIIFTIYIM